MNDELKRLFEANLADLFKLKLEPLSREGELYCEVKSSYLQADLPKLQDLITFILSNDFSYELKLISKIRLGIRQRDLNIDECLKETQQIPNDNCWKGEILFSLGWALDTQKDFFRANKTYIEAYRHLYKNGCINKAVLSLHNAIVSKGNQYPEKRQFSDYHEVLKLALEHKCNSVIGLANLNLSIEYQKTGAIYPALERIDQAIQVLENEVDSDQYYLALGQKCDLLIDIEKYHEAEKIINLMKASTHEYAKGAIFALEEKIALKFNKQSSQEKTSTNIVFSPSFEQRRNQLKQNSSPAQFGKLEGQLLDYLSSGPKDKIAIIKHLYGESEDFFSLEGRLKSLLVRLRKKIPYQINYHDGVYSIDGELTEFKKVKKA